MNKNQAIRQVNEAIGFNQLNSKNMYWSNIVEYGAKERFSNQSPVGYCA